MTTIEPMHLYSSDSVVEDCNPVKRSRVINISIE